MLTSVLFLASLVLYALSCALWDLTISHRPLSPIETIPSVGFERPTEEMVFGRCAVYEEHTLSNVLADSTLHQERWRIIQEPRDCWASGFLSLQEPIYKSCNLCNPSIGLMKKRLWLVWPQRATWDHRPLLASTHQFWMWHHLTNELRLSVKRNPHFRALLHLICDRKSERGSWKELF